jgi:ribonuclease-3
LGLFSSIYQRYFSPQKHFVRQIRRITGLTPTNITLYRVALTHSSTSGNVGNNNERLEFLGDAVMEVLTSEYLYGRYPFKGEGDLTDLRSRMVSRQTLNNIGSKLGLGQLLQTNLPDRVLHSSSAIGNALEALIGAVYMDRGLRSARRFVRKRLIDVYYDLDEIAGQVINFKSLIIQHAQKNGQRVRFRLIEEQKLGNSRVFIMGVFIDDHKLGEGKALNKKRAEQEASRIGCEALGLVNAVAR